MVRFIVAEMVTNLKTETGDIMQFILMHLVLGQVRHPQMATMLTPLL